MALSQVAFNNQPPPSSTKSCAPDAAENILIERYTDACSAGDEDVVDQVQNKILDAIVNAGGATFDRLAPPEKATLSDLDTTLFPPQYSFRLVTVGGILELLAEGTYLLKTYTGPQPGYEEVLITSHLQSPDPETPASLLELNAKDAHVPRYATTAINVVENLLGDGYISHGTVDGTHMCAKVGRDLDEEGSMQRELDCLAQITAHAAQSASPIHVPKLLGLVEMPNGGQVIGFLEELIPASTSQELATLAMVEDIGAIARPRREAWAKQVQQTVSWLHTIGVVWGDGKADNALIHPETDEAWLIDFGGGCTSGWVDEQLAGTVEGDDQAVQKILEFLQI